ncbi:MAG: hypothetical protein ACE5I7_08050 [Candidatus Binatia bacterium]
MKKVPAATGEDVIFITTRGAGEFNPHGCHEAPSSVSAATGT